MNMKVHTHPFSTYSRRVHLALVEKGLEAESVVVNMATGDHRKPEYLAVNPYGRIPALQDGDYMLYESTSILGYLDSKHPEPSLVPADLKTRATMWMHIKLCDLEFSRPSDVIIFPKRFLPEEKWRKDDLAKASKTIQRHVNILEQEIGDKSFLVDDKFTLADVCYLPFLQFLPILDVDIPPNVKRWSHELFERPSAKATTPPDAPPFA